jgi:predicted RNase H-like HicB family nuclease
LIEAGISSIMRRMETHYIAVLDDGGPDRAVGVWFPDLRGCFSAGDTFREAMANAPEAAALWLESLDGQPWPEPRPLWELRADPNFIEEMKDFGDNVVFLAVPVSLPVKQAAE